MTMKQEEIAALREHGALIQKSKEHFIVRLRVTGGHAPATLLRAAADLAERFGDGAAYDLDAVDEAGFGIFANVAIPAYSVLIYSQD